MVRVLVELKADITATTSNTWISGISQSHTWSPLHLASSGKHLEVALFLLKHGADVGARTDKGFTPLHAASECGGLEMARLLIEHGADVDAKDISGQTPLQIASDFGGDEMVKLLSEYGAKGEVIEA
jgi:ankyrin repeat protein